MRFVTRTLALVMVVLAAFWFTAENANEVVAIDLAFFRIRAALPLVVFTSILGGMGLSTWVGWRAEQRSKRRQASRDAVTPGLRDPTYDSTPDYSASASQADSVERSPRS